MEFLKKVWKKAKKIFLDATIGIRAELASVFDDPVKRIGGIALLIVGTILLAYLIAFLHVGLWNGAAGIKEIIIQYHLEGKKYPFWLFLLLEIALLITAYFLLIKQSDEDRNFKLSESSVYGTGREINKEELAQVADIVPPESAMGIILGQLNTRNRQLICSKKNPNSNANIAVFGSPGSGKSFCFVKPYVVQAIRRRESVVITDTKGELWADTVEFARRNGYIVRRLDLKNPANSDAWNPLKELRNDDMRAMIFARTVIKNSGERTDIFATAAESLLKAICLYQERNDQIAPQNKTLYNAYSMLLNTPGVLDSTFAQAARDPKLTIACAAYSTFTQGSPNLRGNIITSLANRLQVLASPSVQNMTSEDDIDLSLPGQKPCLYYCVMSDQHDTMKFMATLFLSFLFLDLVDFADKQQNRKLLVPVHIVMEEFANVGEIPDIDKYLSTCRSRDIAIVLIMQSLGQLQKYYKENFQTILADCATHIGIGFNDRETAELFEWRSGESTVKVKTEQHPAMESPFKVGLNHSTGDGRRQFYTANELMKMPPRRCYIVWQRYDTLMAHTFGINDHPEYKRGHMPGISTEVHIPLSNRAAKAYLRHLESKRVDEYEQWLLAGGDPWPGYTAPKPKYRGPAKDTPPPEIIPYPELEKLALEYAKNGGTTDPLRIEYEAAAMLKRAEQQKESTQSSPDIQEELDSPEEPEESGDVVYLEDAPWLHLADDTGEFDDALDHTQPEIPEFSEPSDPEPTSDPPVETPSITPVVSLEEAPSKAPEEPPAKAPEEAPKDPENAPLFDLPPMVSQPTMRRTGGLGSKPAKKKPKQKEG